MDSSQPEPRWRPSPRTLFAQRFAELFEAAGNPTLRRVAAAAEARMRAAKAPGQKAGASIQRISDWKAGRNVPARFESFLPVLLTLIDEARKSSTSVRPALLDVQEWQRLWTASNEWDPESGDVESPYLGLSSYDRQDAELFFGRTRPTAELAELVRATVGSEGHGGIVMLVGASGAGKSSLLEAGLISELADPIGECAISALTPGADPVRALLAAIGERGTEPDPGTEVEPTAETELLKSEPREHSMERVRAALAEWGMGRRRLLIVDQFEELFTLCRDERHREVFLAALEHIAIRGEREPAAVVIAVRADFYATCLDVPLLEDAIKHRCYVLGPMRLDELAEAISRPAELAGYKLEPGLEELVISELCGLGGRGRRHGYDPGALPLVSHVMAAVWQRRDGMRLTIDGYRQAGGVLGSVAATAEQAWNELTEFEQSVGKQVVLGLVTVGEDSRDTRRKIARDELMNQTVQAAEAALEALARRRLITLDSDSAYLTHEIVLDAWPRLRGWIDEDRVGYLERQRLQADASEWAANGRDPSMLYRGARLTTMQEHAEHGSIGPVAGEFLSAAHAARRRTDRRSSVTKAALALLGVVVLVLAGVAFVQSGTAKQQRDNAIFQALLAESDRLEATDPSLSAQLVAVAEQLRPGDPEVRARLVNTQTMPLARPLPGAAGYVRSVAVSPDGRLVAAGGGDSIRLWDISDRRQPTAVSAPLTGHDDFIGMVAFNPAGTILASAAADDTVRLWDVRDRANPRQIGAPIPIGYPSFVAFGRDGKTVATTHSDFTIALWDIGDPAHPRLMGSPVPKSNGLVNGLAISPDLRLAMVVESDGPARLWRIADALAPATPVADLPGTATSAVFSADGTRIAVASSNGDIQFWDVRDPATPRALATMPKAGSAVVNAELAFSPDGRFFAVQSGELQTSVWDLADPAKPVSAGRPLAGPKGWISALAFVPDGHTLLTGGQDGTVRLWSMPQNGTFGESDRIGWPVVNASGELAVATDAYAGNGTIEIWRIDNGRALRSPGRLESPGQLIAMSPDGHLLLVRDERLSGMMLYDISDPAAAKLLVSLPGSEVGLVTAAAFSSDGRRLITGEIVGDSGLDVVRAWDISDPSRPHTVGGPLSTADDYIFDIAFSLDDTMLAIARMYESVTLWNMSDPVVPTRLAAIGVGQAESGITMAFSPDGRTLVSASDDQSIRVWDIGDPARPTPIGTPLIGHTARVASLAFDSDGRQLVSSGADTTVRLWDFSDRARPASIRHPAITSGRSMVRWAAFSRDGRHLIEFGAGGATLWNLDPRHEVTRICDAAGSILDRQVWADHLSGVSYRPVCE
ncbi:hypothetical protein [Nocardia sp. NPDC050710]|uniref:NACHT and WD repeat domain-containing protein n=1 Tax=Nocardia sp. NPDC050710 TaxID=3157220 RepID=UPI0033C25F40